MADTLPDSFEAMTESKYLRKEDVESPKLLTVASFTKENVARKDEPPKIKWIVHWLEQGVRPMVLGSTTQMQLKTATGAGKPAECVGHQVVAYNDPNVMFGTKMTGGVRLRAPKNRAAPPPVVDPLNEDPPF